MLPKPRPTYYSPEKLERLARARNPLQCGRLSLENSIQISSRKLNR